MSILSEYDSPDDLVVSGYEDIKKFVLANYTRYTVYQLTQLLNVTPGVIQEILPLQKLVQVGCKAAPSTIIVRDSVAFPDDIERFFPHGNR